ncbi:expressed unknown protein [Seminavis robusta]|uniref:Uncharacterized protein n=1 Tax=Seminavis robusta TaxID=568900 RepID=A0A9N8HGQ2_9STRA|nr:expressed unknown protein [Seminavis robusta]|eukprot:Sro651_g181590.1 n/a (181) ;mRNA; f:36717-37259
MSPLTPTGKFMLLLDQNQNQNQQILVQVSTYIDYPLAARVPFLQRHVNSLTHISVSPFRFFCTAVTPNSPYCQEYSEQGIPLGLELWKALADKALHRDTSTLQMVLYLGVFFLIAILFVFMEAMIKVPLTIWIVLLGMQRLVFTKYNSLRKQEQLNSARKNATNKVKNATKGGAAKLKFV